MAELLNKHLLLKKTKTNNLRQLLEKHLPPPWEGLLLQARSTLENGNHTEAITLFRQVWDSSGKEIRVGIEYAQVLVDNMRLDDAEAPALTAIFARSQKRKSKISTPAVR